uniref:Uncharacterized protein n=1 Tax=Anguilla anguilla TaxID=7936 RepID=A0A0E9SMA9_ANGAN
MCKNNAVNVFGNKIHFFHALTITDMKSEHDQ